jgi:Fe-S-cluster-containing hydrogenase component 2
MYASRNIALCNKDCLCLFVCPTGATDTETGQIDRARCLDGCRLCVDACPSKAIYLVMETYPVPKPKDGELTDAMLGLLEGKAAQEAVAETVAEHGATPEEKLLGKALRHSLRIVAEDCAREAGYLSPRGERALDLMNVLGG